MRKYLLIIGILAVLFIAGCANQQTSTTTQTQATGNQGSDQPMIPAPGSKTAKVAIQNFAYSPADITVQKGTTVTWTNLDSVQHTVTSDTGLFDSGRLSQDQVWSYTFNDAGTFSYHCTVHPNMKGTVTVQ